MRLFIFALLAATVIAIPVSEAGNGVIGPSSTPFWKKEFNRAFLQVRALDDASGGDTPAGNSVDARDDSSDATVDAYATRSQWYYAKDKPLDARGDSSDATVDAYATRSQWYYAKDKPLDARDDSSDATVDGYATRTQWYYVKDKRQDAPDDSSDATLNDYSTPSK